MSEHAGDLLANPTTAGGLGVVVTAVLGWLGTRLLGKPAIETAIRDTFKELLDQLRHELRMAIKERDEARDEASDLRARVEELQATIAALELRVARASLPRPC